MKKNKNSKPKKVNIAQKNSVSRFVFLDKYAVYFIIIALLLLTLVLIKTAWLCDDAFITLRTIDNFVNGYGLRYNVVERVQAFTHPLWLFLLSVPYFFFRDPFYTPIIISILITLFTAIFVVYKISASKFNSFLFVLLLIISKSFIDYSTSGLENPLSFLIAAVFVYVYLKYEEGNRKIFLLSLITSLALLNRMDSVLFYLPALIYLTIQSKNKKSIWTVFIGLAPFIVWTVFSVIYYGYPFPNTYYAKLNTGIPKLELFSQGLYYFVNSLKFDPITLVSIFICTVIMGFKRDKKYYPLVLGIIFYLIYIIYIGGDFMSGRFFSLPFIISLAIIFSFISIPNIASKIGILAGLFLFMFLSPLPPILSNINYTDGGANFMEEHGISDERGYYYHNTSLWKALNGEKMPDHPMIDGARRQLEIKEKIFLAGAIGFFGYYAGPSVYVIDVYALADPLLSKYHVVKYDPIFGAAYEKTYKRKSPQTWRIGHFLRPIPPGYTLSLLKNQSLLDDSKFNELYDVIKLITQADIFSLERFTAILKMNFGQYDYLIDNDKYSDYTETVFHDDLIRFRPDYARYYYSRANYFYRRKRYAQSIPDFEKSVSLDHYHGLSWYKLSIALFFTNKYEKSLICYQNAKKLGEEVDPEFEKYLFRKIDSTKAIK